MIKMTRDEIEERLYTYNWMPYFFLCNECQKVNSVYVMSSGNPLTCSNCGSQDIELVEVVNE